MADQVYNTPGTHEYTVPSGVNRLYLKTVGAAGYGSEAGRGHSATGFLPVTPGETLQINVGGQDGTNGGGGGPRPGGGASDVRQAGTTLSDRHLVGAGGGGEGETNEDAGGAGGDGGHSAGGGGSNGTGSASGYGGFGGTQDSGGSGGSGGDSGGSGGFGEGGAGGSGSATGAYGYGGGGGAGWYGGGGGGAADGSVSGAGGGGGGSSYASGSISDASFGGEWSTADGYVEIEESPNASAVQNFAVSGERDTEIDLTWDVSTETADGQRIYRDGTSGVDPATATLVADLGPTVEAFTDTDLPNGTAHYYVVETYVEGTGANTAVSDEVSGQTTLPDVTGFELDATVQDELTVGAITPQTNAGRYRIRWKRSVDSSYPTGNEATVDYNADPLEYVITGLIDGEQYDVGVRTETDDATGAWHTASEVTKLVAASGITIENLTETSADSVSWTVESDFEGSQGVWWRREDYGYDDPKGELLATVSPTTSSVSGLPMIHPDRDYTVTIRAQTQYVHADGVKTTTSPSAGLAQHPAPPRGWYAEVDHPSGSVRTVTIADGAQWQPQLNGLPRVRLPVPRDETWRSEVFEGQPLRVWYNGRRLPIDELETVTTEAGQTILEGRGGLQLEKAIEAEYSSRAAHLAVEDLIQQETDYTANVDAPSAGVSIDNKLLLAADTTGEWQDLAVFGDTDPIEASGGTLEVLETAYFTRGLLNTTDYSGTLRNHVDYINGEGLHLTSSGDYAEWPLSFDYDIPAERVGIAVRDEILNQTDAEWSYNGQTIGSFSISQASHAWEDLRNGFYAVDHSVSTISAGETQTLRVDITGDADYVVDAIVVFDTQYYPDVGNWANEGWNAVHEDNGHLDGPPTHPPDGAQVRTVDAETPYSVVAANVGAVLNDTTGAQALAASNDQGVSWLEAANSSTLDQSFADDGGTLRARFTLGGYGSRNDASPRFGYQPQTVDSVEVRADLDDTPVIVNQTFEGNLGGVLSEIADQGDFIWEVRRDGTYSIEWTRAGQRQAATDLDVSSYEDTVTIESKTLACEVIGGRQSVSGRQFTADTQSFVSLGDTDIIAGTEYVYDPATSEGYDRGQDYEINNRAGEIRATSSGTMSAGDTYAVDYEYKPRGRHEADEWDGDATYERREEIPGLTSRRGCQQAALRIIQETRDGLTEADVQFADLNPDQSLVEAINIDALPGDDPLEVREINFADGQSQALLGDGQSVSDAVNEIRSQIEAVARRS